MNLVNLDFLMMLFLSSYIQLFYLVLFLMQLMILLGIIQLLLLFLLYMAEGASSLNLHEKLTILNRIS